VDVALAIVVAVLLVAATVLIHHEVLRTAGNSLKDSRLSPRAHLLVIFGAVMSAHLAQVLLYAVAYYLLEAGGIGAIGGEFRGSPIDYFYFSITSFTTLGVGDLFPHGAMRIVAGVQALNGFVLVGWSASFSYLAMQQVWDRDREL